MIISRFEDVVEYCGQRLNLDSDTSIQFCAALLAALVVLALPMDAFAGTTNAIGNTICKIVELMQGDIARGVAAIGIIFLGFSLFLGKISWGVALALGIGIGAIFGASDLVDLLGGDNVNGESCVDNV